LPFIYLRSQPLFDFPLIIGQTLVLVDHISAGVEQDREEASGGLEFKDGLKRSAGFRLTILGTSRFAADPTGHYTN
jgi:hypothetical protein